MTNQGNQSGQAIPSGGQAPQPVNPSAILSGDWVGSAWSSSPEWTPYAEGIAAAYPIQIPWYLSIPIFAPADPSINFPQFRAAFTRPQQNDVLILGANIYASDADIPNLNFLYIQIGHQETGINWVAPNAVGFMPLLALGGLNRNLTPIIKLPEAFFLPKQTLMRFMWTQFRTTPTVSISAVLTLIGVQLVNYSNTNAPEVVAMPDGSYVRVGSRLPWFGCLPFGRRGDVGRQFGDYILRNLEQAVQYSPPVDCDVEIHDIYANFKTTDVFPGEPRFLVCKFNDTSSRSDWTPGMSPTTSVFGDERQVYPAMPLCKPDVVSTGHRLQMVMQNNTPTDVQSGTITLRGVRRCQY